MEDHIETYLAGLEESLAAPSAGALLLREEFSAGDVPLSFSERERVLEQLEQRIDEELRTQEEALRSIPPGLRCLSEAEQARAAAAAGLPTLADRESMMRAAEQQVGEELDRLEEELLSIAVGEELLAEAAGALTGAGRTRSLRERWETCERVKSGVEEELDRQEAPIRADSAGEAFLRAARLEVLGAAEREATRGERARIVKAAASAKRAADERWNEEKAVRIENLRVLLGGLDLYHAHVADLDPKWSLTENTPSSREHDEAALAAAESDDTRLKRLDAVLSDEADAARYQEVLDQAVGQFKTSDLDNALAAGEKARAERETQQWEKKRDALVDELRALPGGLDLYHAHLADRDSKWDRKRNRKSSREHIDAALGAAKSDAPRLERLRGVLSDEADVAYYREVLDQVVGQFKTADLDNALAAGEKARAERETQQWEEKRDALVDELRALPGGLDLYHAHLADRDSKWDRKRNRKSSREHIDAALGAAKLDAPRLERLRGVLSDEADVACYREVLDQVVGQFKTADLDNALAAVEKARAERETQQWEEKRDALVEKLRALPGGLELYHARLADLDPKWSLREHTPPSREHDEAALAATESDDMRLERLRGVLSNEADAACYREVLDQVVGQFKTSDLDNALAAVEKARAEREAQQWEEKRDALVDELRALPGGLDLYHAHLADRDSKWDRKRNRKSSREHIDAALGAAKLDAPRLERLRGVLSDEAAAARYREELDKVAGQFTTADIDQALSAAELDRRRRAAAAQRVSRVERLFGAPPAAAAFIMALDEPDPSSRLHPTDIDRALDIAEREFGRREGEQQFPGASSATRRRAGDDSTEAADTDSHVQQVIDRLHMAVERQLVERTDAARLAQRARNSVRSVSEKTPPVRKLPRRVPATRARNSVTRVAEKSPPVPRPARLVPGATREDAVAAAPLIVRARLPEPVQQELRPSVDIAARELAGEFRHFLWWSYAGGELEQLHSREDRYLEFHDTKDGPVEIGMLRIVLEKDVYEKACRLVEHPVAEPPTNLGELVLAFIRRLQDAVDHLIDLVLDRAPEPALQSRGAESMAKVRGRNHIEENPDPAPAATSAPASAPEPAALNVERVRLAVQAVKDKLPRTRPYPGNPSHRPLALSDERLDHLAETADGFVKTVVTELQSSQAYYAYARSESERTYLHPRIERRHKENLDTYEKAKAKRRLFSRRPPQPTWAEAESVVIKEFEAEQRVVIKDVCRRIQELSPAAVQQSIRKEEADRAREQEHEEHQRTGLQEEPSRQIKPTRDRGGPG